MADRKLNEVFVCDGRRLKVVRNLDCVGCYFSIDKSYCAFDKCDYEPGTHVGPCKLDRTDRVPSIFKDMGPEDD